MQKLYYSISEVAKLIGEPAYVLRYWEKEFPILSPKKNRAGNRIYSEQDIEILRTIKSLLREQKLSMNGALDEINRIFVTKKSKKLNAKVQSSESKTSKKIQTKRIKLDEGLFSPRNVYKIILLEIRDNLKSLLDLLKRN